MSFENITEMLFKRKSLFKKETTFKKIVNENDFFLSDE